MKTPSTRKSANSSWMSAETSPLRQDRAQSVTWTMSDHASNDFVMSPALGSSLQDGGLADTEFSGLCDDSSVDRSSVLI